MTTMTNNNTNQNDIPFTPNNTNNNNTQDEASRLAAVLAETKRQVNDLGNVVQAMEQRLARARGTGDLTEQARAAMNQVRQEVPTNIPSDVPAYLARQTPAVQQEPARPRRGRPPKIHTQQGVVTVPSEPTLPGQLPLMDRIIIALSKDSMTISKLCRVVGGSPGAVTDVLKTLRQQHRIYNVGSAEYPLWTYKIGDQTDTGTLTATIRRLISERPMTTRELVDATGARLQRVSGVVVQLLRGPDRILNMSHSRFGRWFLVPPEAKTAKLVDPRKPAPLDNGNNGPHEL